MLQKSTVRRAWSAWRRGENDLAAAAGFPCGLLEQAVLVDTEDPHALARARGVEIAAGGMERDGACALDFRESRRPGKRQLARLAHGECPQAGGARDGEQRARRHRRGREPGRRRPTQGETGPAALERALQASEQLDLAGGPEERARGNPPGAVGREEDVVAQDDVARIVLELDEVAVDDRSVLEGVRRVKELGPIQGRGFMSDGVEDFTRGWAATKNGSRRRAPDPPTQAVRSRRRLGTRTSSRWTPWSGRRR